MDEQKELNQPQDQFSFSEISSEDYLNCALCGQALIFTHNIDYLKLSVKEEASCSCCKVKLKSREYKIQ